MIPRTSVTYEDRVAYIDADLPLLVESPEEYAKRTDRHIVCHSFLVDVLFLSFLVNCLCLCVVTD